MNTFPTRLLIIIAIIVFTSNIYAQENTDTRNNQLIIHGAYVLPTGSFGQVYNFRVDTPMNILSFIAATLPGIIPVPTKERTEIGNALSGFSAGISHAYQIVPNISILSTVDFTYNPVNTLDFETKATNLYQEFDLSSGSIPIPSNLIFNAKVTSPSHPYLHTFILLGGRYDVNVHELIRLYGFAQAGLVVGIYPQHSITHNIFAQGNSSTLPITQIRSTTDLTINFQQAVTTAFAYKVGIGGMIGNRLNVGVSYCAARPSYQVGFEGKLKQSFGDLTSPIITSDIANSSILTYLPMSVLQVSLGYIFNF